jgi:hypothetical protein
MTPQPLSTVALNVEPMTLAERGKNGLRCGGSGAVLEKAAVEVRGVALLNGVIPLENSMVTVSRSLNRFG